VTEKEWMATAAQAAKDINRLMKQVQGIGMTELEYGKLAFESWLRTHPCPRDLDLR
jgi:hypothetical protein